MNLNIKNLSKHYDEEKALDNLDLTIHNMKAVAVVGPSGGGKSTLLRLIAGLEAPTGGLVSVNGIPIDYTEKMLREYRKRIGFVFQSHNLFPHWSAVKNITVPLVKVFGIEQSEAKERALALLTRFGLEEHAKKLPVPLSGGQQQRISIARAMARRPEILLLDEPTSALDPQLTKEVLDMIIELKDEGTNIMMATHEMAFAKRAAEEIVFVDSGKIGGQGNSEEFFKSGNKQRLDDFLSHVFA